MARSTKKLPPRPQNQGGQIATAAPLKQNGAGLNTEPVFDAANILLQRRMRFNPLRTLDPSILSLGLDQFDMGILRPAAMLWDAMCKRDDTLITVKPQLENSIASKAWGVFKKKGADETEAARHAATLQYFYEHVRATDAFDRNEHGGKERLIAQMMRADSFQYAVHHFIWKPRPGQTVEVEGAEPAPVIAAELEYVPLWYFENTTGTLRFLPFGGFGVIGDEIDFENEWMVTCGRGLMFAASICYVFKRLSFQDWTTFNERYAQNKIVGMTRAAKDSAQGQALLQVLGDFNGDQAIAFFECGNTEEPPIQLLGPTGTAAVDIWEKFLERQDRKVASMFRGNDLSMMSRAGKGERPSGASLQADEGDAMETGCCRMIAGALHDGIDRKIIRFCYGEDVEPLAYFGLPEKDIDDTGDTRESAGFLADRGAQVAVEPLADRLGIQLAAEGETALTAGRGAPPTAPEDGPLATENAAAIEADVARLVQTVETALTANSNGNHDANGRFASGVGGIPLSPKNQSRELSPNEQRRSIAAALQASKEGAQAAFSLGRVSGTLAARIKAGTNDERDWSGKELRIDSDFVTHARRYHPNLTDEDFYAIPDLLDHADNILPSVTDRDLPAVEFHKHLDGRNFLLVSATLNKAGQIQMTTLKKSKPENRA